MEIKTGIQSIYLWWRSKEYKVEQGKNLWQVGVWKTGQLHAESKLRPQFKSKCIVKSEQIKDLDIKSNPISYIEEKVGIAVNS